jgi:hypothetical protein
MATPRNYIGNTNKLISHQRREEEKKRNLSLHPSLA